MKFLFICDYFEPINTIGAVRPTEFAECFEAMGHSVNVLTLDYSKWKHNVSVSEKHIVNRISVDDSPFFRRYRFFESLKKTRPNQKANFSDRKANDKNGKCPKGNRNGFLTAIKRYLSSFYFDRSRIIFGRCASRAFAHELKKNVEHYDVVFSTYSGFGPLIGASKYKKKHKDTHWICDIRDAVYYEMFIKTHRHYYKNFLNRYCKDVTLFSFVSKGVMEDSILPKKRLYPCSIITNGFLDYHITIARKQNEKMTLLYAGCMYSERKFTSIFKALGELSSRNEPLLVDILFCGEPECYRRFLEQATFFGVGKYVRYCGYLTKNELNTLELNCDMFLISSWNYENYKGVIPGKLFEYFAYCKPILGHVSGTLPGSDIKRMINETKSGFCSDDIEDGDYEKMLKYLSNQYSAFLKTGFCTFDANMEKLDCYKRMKLAEKMINDLKEAKDDNSNFKKNISYLR